MKRLINQRAVVTGGGSGIGLAIARALTREGCRTVIAGRRAEVLAEAVIGTEGMSSCPVDVADRASVDSLFTFAERELGGVDILVNAAGVNIRRRTLQETTPEDWRRVMEINASGAFHCLQAVIPGMRERGGGLVINISSIAGKRAAPLGGVAYNASKFAMTALGTSAWVELAPLGIRVTNVYPGEVNTPILEHRPNPVGEEQKATMLQPDDVAEMVLAVCLLPPRAHVAELLIKPLAQSYV